MSDVLCSSEMNTRKICVNLHVLTKVPQKFEILFVPLQIDKKP